MTMMAPDITAQATAPAVQLRGIKKRYGAVVALRGVDLHVGRGEALGLVGDNGAGKSTLMKVISGAVIPDSGEMLVNGKPAKVAVPRDSRDHGIEMVYQDLALCDHLDVASNFYLGREPKRLGMLQGRAMHAEARRQLQSLGIRIKSTTVPISALSGGQRQAVAIGRALSFDPSVLILDEPTAALGVREVALVLDLIREIKKKGVGVILISHRLQDILDVCDRVTVLYDGQNVKDLTVSELTFEELVRNIVLSGRGGAA